MENTPENALATISKAKQFLALAGDINDAINLRGAAVAAYAYATAQNLDEAAQLAMEVKLRAERRAGEFIIDMKKNGTIRQGRPKENEKRSTLERFNIERKESHRWQRVAQIPEERFEIFLNNTKSRTQKALLLEAARELTPEPDPTEIPEFPDRGYHCLVIDPPWPVKKIEREARPNQGAFLDYPTWTLEQISELPIPDLAEEEGCHVFLWVTQKYLPEGLNLFEKWSVKYQCLLTWVKTTGITPFSWMYNTEHVLFGRIGSLKLSKLGIKLSFEGKVREHSRKPDTFYEIVRQVSPNPRLELFAREPRAGFEVWGNEVNKFEGDAS